MKFSIATILFVLFVFAGAASAQNSDMFPFPDRDRRRGEDDSKIVKDMLAKQQSEREKREHKELLDRGDKALALTESLERAFEKNEKITADDERKLADLENLVEKIRDDLGGDGDADDEPQPETARPKDLREGFIALKNTTEKLVSELKKTTRYSVSIVAIESTNALIKVVRFLRLRN